MSQAKLTNDRFRPTPPEDVRADLLGTTHGQPIIINGGTYTVKRARNDTLLGAFDCQSIEFQNGDELLIKKNMDWMILQSTIDAVKQDYADEHGIPVEDVDQEDVNEITVPEECRIPYSAVSIKPNPVLEENDVSNIETASTRDCPNQNADSETHTTAFQYDTVPEYLQSVSEIPDEYVEVRRCLDCDSQYAVVRSVDLGSSGEIPCRGVTGWSDPETVSGLFQLKETCLMRGGRTHGEYNGVYTAAEVEEYVKLRVEEGETYGFSSVKDSRVRWWDDQPYTLEKSFKRIPAEEQ